MDFPSSVFDWLSEREAGISAVVGTVMVRGVVFEGVGEDPGLARC